MYLRRRFFCSSVFLEAGYSCKMGKKKKDTNAGVARRRKEIKERAAEQLCMDNISTGRNESNISSILDSSESLSASLLLLSRFRIFTELFFSLYTSIFFPPHTIAIYSSACRTFASSLIGVSFLLVLVLKLVYAYL